MAHTILVVALSVVVATSPASAASREPASMSPAPAASADAKYCLRVEPFTGSHIELTQCWTRAEWTEQGVDVDQEWAKEGVGVINSRS
ncbi:MAG: hypothetical protein ABIT68_06090 [Sphingomicrobium sp.]